MFDCWQPFGWTRLLLILKILFWLKRIWASNRNLRRSLFTFYVTGRLRFFRVTEFMTLFAIVCFIVHQLLCTACARSYTRTNETAIYKHFFSVSVWFFRRFLFLISVLFWFFGLKYVNITSHLLQSEKHVFVACERITHHFSPVDSKEISNKKQKPFSI